MPTFNHSHLVNRMGNYTWSTVEVPETCTIPAYFPDALRVPDHPHTILTANLTQFHREYLFKPTRESGDLEVYTTAEARKMAVIGMLLDAAYRKFLREGQIIDISPPFTTIPKQRELVSRFKKLQTDTDSAKYVYDAYTFLSNVITQLQTANRSGSSQTDLKLYEYKSLFRRFKRQKMTHSLVRNIHQLDLPAFFGLYNFSTELAVPWEYWPHRVRQSTYAMTCGLGNLVDSSAWGTQINDLKMRMYNKYVSTSPTEWEFCSVCGAQYPLSNITNNTQTGRKVCTYCLHNNFVYNQERDTWVCNYRANEQEIGEHLERYNAPMLMSTQMTELEKKHYDKKPTRKPPFLGVEVETELTRNTDDAVRIVKQMKRELHNWAILKRDGSLENGAEVVTRPATFDVHMNGKTAKSQSPWTPFLEGMAKQVYSHFTDTCGIHVHISRNSMTPGHLAKMLVFVNSAVNDPFIHVVAQRTNSRWAKRVTRNLLQAAKAAMQPGEGNKYTRVNLANAATVEFRIFKGDTSKEGIFKCLSFVQALYEYTKDCSLKQLEAEHFVAWLKADQVRRSRFKYLVKHLKRMGAY